ncbi:phosphoadenosine phosphosulfate reductase family protein [Leucothrix arctica]|uniref:Phosphoadenylylsulfate reductase n=1 Tax=Leucothrix arctica TaxID=1481894 RepID=A0A317CB14_9GAMM|nr:phosphoadenosine phosphosulfate reductase family protein [Leucothrix arctica]PWQ95331.1 phosphoadenylylsulfate reductase [Leucothrix arctica]
MTINIEQLNADVAGKRPQDIIKLIFAAEPSAFVTTNFGPQATVLLHMLTQVQPDIPVIWIDSGLNKVETYEFADIAAEELNLNMKVYTPTITAARFEAVMGGIPSLDDARHTEFTKQFKLDPFQRAMNEQTGKLWFSAVRREQTAVRAEMDYVAEGPYGLMKVAPLLDWTAADMENYIEAFDLPNETDYFDPTKAANDRECGLHTLQVK